MLEIGDKSNKGNCNIYSLLIIQRQVGYLNYEEKKDASDVSSAALRQTTKKENNEDEQVSA